MSVFTILLISLFSVIVSAQLLTLNQYPESQRVKLRLENVQPVSEERAAKIIL